MVRYAFSLAILAAAVTAVAGQSIAPTSTAPVDTGLNVTSPPGTSPPGTSSPGTSPPGTSPPGTSPPGTSPPGTSPPGTSPPGTSSPGTSPPGTSPPGTVTPISESPAPTAAVSVEGSPAPGATPVPVPTMVSSLVAYFEEPKLKWSVATKGFGLESGNAVTVSNDGSLVYVTRATGQLDILEASDGKVMKSVVPEQNSAGDTIACNSGVYFGKFFEKSFAVYAIIDTPFGDFAESTSRIVAVSHPDGELLFTSENVTGKIMGTPIISADGQYIFATHNENLDSDTNPPIGSFSIFSFDKNGTVIWTEKYAGIDGAAATAPYTPLGVAHNPTSGKYTGGELNLNDIVVWSTSSAEGTGDGGYIYAFQIPVTFTMSLVATLATVRLRDVRWNALARPALSVSGQSLFFGVRQSAIRGWTGLTAYDEIANINVQLKVNAAISGTPIKNAPKFSNDEKFVFVTSADTEINGLNAVDGTVTWTYDNANGVYTSEPQVSPDNVRVYAQQGDGTLDCLDQTTGNKIWSLKCEKEVCSGAVLSEFSVSANGLFIYHGDNAGNINAYEIGTSLSPGAPTMVPALPIDGATTTAPATTATEEPSEPGNVTTPPATVASDSNAPSAFKEDNLSPPPTFEVTKSPTKAPVSTSATSQVTVLTSAFIVGIALFIK